ncbi:response regulator [Phormidium sp. CLA17]|uniref:response regulator n=1 Tax=Leptolyngbya sp. Cla-17 TaxID=2803751 RepID=UPI0014908CE0|nr:response regulator [Leptolyngbya sp. Cla-17]MBM0743993.1 response regulator [Leptolyngbya sp. Cla-17]
MKILLVEDDQATCALLESAVSAHHVVETAADGQSAMDLVEQFEYDLVLLDVGIPEVDGISVCKRLRARGSQVPILLLTAKDRATDRVVGLDAGADDYMIKPFNTSELLARIRALLRRGRTATPSTVTYGDLQIDCAINEIRYGQQALRLTPKEYGILELLLLHPQRIFSRAVLIDRLWELDESPTESAISSHVKAIRQKLKAAGANQDLIETIYGFGYRFRSLKTPTPTHLDALSSDAHKVATEAAESMLLELWERFKDSFDDQIAVLEQVIVALESGRLTDDLQQTAKQTVHKLVGSLGVYGFPQGSAIARQIEGLLQPSEPQLQAAAINQIAQLVTALKQELQREPQLAQAAQGAIAQSTDLAMPLPFVLVVDDDQILTDRLKAEANGRSFQLEAAVNLAEAQRIVEYTIPDVVLLDLTFADSNENGLTWLETLRHQHPQLPVLVYTARDHLSDRVAAARLGIQAFLQKPIASAQIFQAIQATLQQTKAQGLRPQPAIAGKVLIVDDDPVILHRVSLMLSPWGLQVTPLIEPQRFWETLIDSAPNLLILDVEMPGLSGIELCQVVRNDPQWGDLPILFLTAHQDEKTLVQAFSAGGDDYIRKPILEPELIARVLNRLQPEQIRRQQFTAAFMNQLHDVEEMA